MENFSVLMSVYHKEKASNLSECIDSLINQSVQPNEIVIIEDGPLNEELYECIELYISKFPKIIKRYPLKENKGLGLALRFGVTKCKHELIARMDTDDICTPDRFERELLEFYKDEDLKIVGSFITEFDTTIDNILSIRKVPIENLDIIKYQKRRCAFNHMTVMYKKSAVIEAGNYENALYMEDDVLWSRMLIKNMKAKNIDKSLVYARTGLNMIMRRGGWKYFMHYRDARKLIRKIGFINLFEYNYTLMIQFIICIMPKHFRLWIFKNLLR